MKDYIKTIKEEIKTLQECLKQDYSKIGRHSIKQGIKKRKKILNELKDK